MGKCVYCGEQAGFLRKAHKKCKLAHEQGELKIVDLVTKACAENAELKVVENEIKQIASTSYIDKKSLHDLLIKGWEKAVEEAFNDGVLTEEEGSVLENFRKYFSLSREELDKHGAFAKVIKGAVIREILKGKVPKMEEVSGELPFNLQKSEDVVWVFHGVKYYEQKTKIRYIGGARGVSIRIAKGVYFRSSGFKGERVQTSETVHVDTGLMCVTNKHIYFSGEFKSFRIPFSKIVVFKPYFDGIGLQRDAQTAKPQIFITGDGWFTYNLVVNLSRR